MPYSVNEESRKISCHLLAKWPDSCQPIPYMANDNQNLLRKKFPKVRIVSVKGETFYQVDARRTGTNGKRETYSNQKEALGRAAEIEDELGLHGTEALIDSVLRNMALHGQAMLKPYGKTIMDGILFYKAHLDEAQRKTDSSTIAVLANEWFKSKETGSNRKIKALTLAGIRKHVSLLKKQWGTKRILDYKEADLQTYLDGLELGQCRKSNICTLTNQFFNWCVAKSYLTTNPVKKIDIAVPKAKIHILTPEEAKRHLQVCVEKYPDYTLYVAISLFAGLRPTECKLLKWENIHLEERQITVQEETSKVAETRNVPIEDNLLVWLQEYKGERKGFVTKQANFSKSIRAARVEMGYREVIFTSKRVEGKPTTFREEKNATGPEWPQDVYRHSYASYWLAKNQDRAHLAEHMGNSIQIIKRHYKAVVSNKEQKAYWGLYPGLKNITQPTQEQIEGSIAKGIRGALAAKPTVA